MTYFEELIARHKTRRARIAAKAVPDKPIECLSASVRCGGFSRPVQAQAPKPSAPSEDIQEWVKRQLERHKAYQFWFSIESEGGLKTPTIDLIRRTVSKFYDVSIQDMISQRKTAEVVRVRMVAIFISRELTTHSLPEIGRRFGNRDHTTILHAERKIRSLIAVDEKLAQDIQTLKSAIMEAVEP